MSTYNSQVAIVHSKAYEKACCLSPKFKNRHQMVMELIEAYGLLDKMDQLPVHLNIDPLKLTGFHSSDYLEALVKLEDFSQNNEDLDEEMEGFGFAYDCPAFEGVIAYATAPVAGTLTAAQALVDGKYKIAINWGGGWHHAKRSEASGFCYLNDIVLGVLKLREGFSRILYVDLDLHHGDGVEEGFSGTGSVVTWSLHHYSCGFFPNSGGPVDEGDQPGHKGQYSTLNIPLEEGMDDASYIATFKKLAPQVLKSFRPEALVIQCGADALASDPHRCFNLTLHSYTACVAHLLSWNLPTLLLGGGGYNYPDTAKLWTTLTSLAIHSSHSPKQTSNPTRDDIDSVVSNLVAKGDETVDVDATISAVVPNDNGAVGNHSPQIALDGMMSVDISILRHISKITSDAELSVLLSSDIPEHQYWRCYGPDFDLSVTPSLRPNKNTQESIDEMLVLACDRMVKYSNLNFKD